MMSTSEKATQNGAGSPFLKSAHLSRIERADERTRTADLLITSEPVPYSELR